MRFVDIKNMKDVRLLKYDDRNLQHDNQILAVGLSNRTLMKDSVVAVFKKVLDKFPFDTDICKDFRVLDPAICRLVSTFAPLVDQELLKDEFDDYSLMPDEESESRLGIDGQKRGFSSCWLDKMS